MPIFIRNEDGTLDPAEPLKSRCEHDGCSCNDGRDYVRKQSDMDPDMSPDWIDEPIYLCQKHGIDHTPIE